ncbi:MAG TPA: DUF839 domain-containing protein [Acidimicrobiia bacterium]|nr:DUF839 domain-containing protein [Acidimicrobiia bacterium]
MHRRAVLRNGLALGGTAVASAILGVGGPVSAAPASSSSPAPGPYGSLEGRRPDGNGLVLPEGFSSRIVAVGGTGVGATDYTWPLFPDGKGTIATPDGGWILACNHEVFDFQTIGESAGGASAVRFDSGGSILDAYPILEGSHSNSRGATTPWGTWLSCQEAHQGDGRIWECDPTGDSPAVPRNALGVRTHGSVAVDPLGGHCYMTEAHRDGRLYRFRMLDESASGAALADGPLEAMAVDPDGGVSWIPVPDPSGTVAPTRVQAADGFVTPVGGGVWVHDGSLLFTTALDDRVHAVDLANQRHWILWDGSGHRQPLVGIGDLTVAPASGDLFVAEDRGDMELVQIGIEGLVAPFCRMVGDDHRLSAVTGPCFDPSGTRLYISSLRGRGEALVRDVVEAIDWGDGVEGRHVGVTYEVSGPFRSGPPLDVASVSTTTVQPTASPATTVVRDATAMTAGTTAQTAVTTFPPTVPPTTTLDRASGQVDMPASGTGGAALGLGAVAVLALGAGVVALRRRSSDGSGG